MNDNLEILNKFRFSTWLYLGSFDIDKYWNIYFYWWDDNLWEEVIVKFDNNYNMIWNKIVWRSWYRSLFIKVIDNNIYLIPYWKFISNNILILEEWLGIFIKFDLSGDLIYAKSLWFNYIINNVEEDGDGNVYIIGTVNYNGIIKPFVIKVDNNGKVLYSKILIDNNLTYSGLLYDFINNYYSSFVEMYPLCNDIEMVGDSKIENKYIYLLTNTINEFNSNSFISSIIKADLNLSNGYFKNLNVNIQDISSEVNVINGSLAYSMYPDNQYSIQSYNLAFSLGYDFLWDKFSYSNVNINQCVLR